MRIQLFEIENVQVHKWDNYRIFFLIGIWVDYGWLLVLSRSINAWILFLSMYCSVFKCFFVRKNEYSSSGDDNPINGAIWSKKEPCTNHRVLHCVRITYINKICMAVLVSWWTTMCTMLSSFNHASDEWYRWCRERRRHGRLEWTKMKIVFIYYSF